MKAIIGKCCGYCRRIGSMKINKNGVQRGTRLVASLAVIGLLLAQMPVAALLGTPVLGQGQAIYTDPGDDDSGDFLGINGLAGKDITQAGLIAAVVYGAVHILSGGAEKAAVNAVAGGVSGSGTIAASSIITGNAKQPIWDNLSNDKNNRFTRFTKLAEINDVKGEPLRDKNSGPYTTFALTDTALQALPETDLAKLMDAKNKEANKQTMLRYVVRGKYTTKDLEKLESGFPLATVSGDTLIVTKNADGSVNVNGVPVLREDIDASNGVSHPINSVL